MKKMASVLSTPEKVEELVIKTCRMRVWLLSNDTEIACDQATATKSHWCAVGLNGP